VHGQQAWKPPRRAGKKPAGDTKNTKKPKKKMRLHLAALVAIIAAAWTALAEDREHVIALTEESFDDAVVEACVAAVDANETHPR